MNECDSNPCSQYASCIDKVGLYECMCMFGYNGENCEEGTFQNIINYVPLHMCTL